MRSAVRLAMLCTGLAAAGCGFGHKPYANDPLLRGGRAVWLTREPAPPPVPAAPAAVDPPNPPTSRRD